MEGDRKQFYRATIGPRRRSQPTAPAGTPATTSASRRAGSRSELLDALDQQVEGRFLFLEPV
jgi:hypothetical protein